jgi:hypothetical protein|tara:strand:- start:350 stop:619 length:270 start_codon:yes stop_codon:yes gene_type:complete
VSLGITISVDGVDHVVETTAGDLVRLEREYQIKAAEMSVESMSVEWVMFLAFVGLKRQKVIEMSFDEFLDVADTVEEELDPPPLPLSSP